MDITRNAIKVLDEDNVIIAKGEDNDFHIVSMNYLGIQPIFNRQDKIQRYCYDSSLN